MLLKFLGWYNLRCRVWFGFVCTKFRFLSFLRSSSLSDYFYNILIDAVSVSAGDLMQFNSARIL